MKKIKYITFYNTQDNIENRNVAPATVTKVSYMFDAICRAGYSIEAFSLSTVRDKKRQKGKIKKINENLTLRFFSSPGDGKTFFHKFFRLLYKFKIFLFFLFTLKRKDTVVIYHSLYLMKMMKILKRIKKFKLIVDIEEIYGDAYKLPKISSKEYKFFKIADSYMFCSEILERKINVTNKPSIVIYGTYEIKKTKEVSFNDKLIHCVYAGTLNPGKRGAVSAIEAAAYLPDNYYVHILGTGTEEHIQNILSAIEKTKAINPNCKVAYDGFLTGKECDLFLQKCQIGLSTQNMNESFNDTSFPSKILNYLANGLVVINPPIKAVTESLIKDSVFYYKEQTPQSIAKAILAVDLKRNGLDIIKKLDEEFVKNVVNILG